MLEFKIELLNPETDEITYGYVWACTWAEAEREAKKEFSGYVTNVVDVLKY